jgi:RNA polymerase sigma-70 factor (ECF subfamily)
MAPATRGDGVGSQGLPPLDHTTSSVARCIHLAREGQSEALAQILDSYRNYLRLIAVTCFPRQLRGKADPSDVVQDALVKVHESFHQFRGSTEQDLLAWMRSILVRLLVDFHRRFQGSERQVGRERSLEDLADRSSVILERLVDSRQESPSAHAHQREQSVLLADALARLAPDDREVIVLRNLMELEWEEVARGMGRSADAARMLWTRAVRHLGDQLGEMAP